MIFDILRYPPTLIDSIQTTMAEGILAMVAFAVALLVALSVHEFAHGYVAYKCGDSTAKLYGRLTVNPIKHIDFVGALMLFFVGFGWAKPVPVNYNNLKKPKRDAAFVSIAGISANLIFAFLSTGLLLLVSYLAPIDLLFENRFVYMVFYIIYFFLQYFILLNIGLALFNILPIFPLDGYRFIESYSKYDNKLLQFLRQYSIYILMIVLLLSYLPVFSPFTWYIQTVSDFLIDLFISFWGLFGLA